jgi:hypothetical protein
MPRLLQRLEAHAAEVLGVVVNGATALVIPGKSKSREKISQTRSFRFVYRDKKVVGIHNEDHSMDKDMSKCNHLADAVRSDHRWYIPRRCPNNSALKRKNTHRHLFD